MRFGLAVLAFLGLTGCLAPTLETPLQLRQDSLVVYLTEPVVRPIAGQEQLRRDCDWQIIPLLERRAAQQDRTERMAHFGAVYSKAQPLADGRVLCSTATDWNGGSVAEISPSVAARCLNSEPVGVPCTLVYDIVPARYDPARGPSIGAVAGAELIDRIEDPGYGAIALSSNGAWSVKSRFDTRAQADAAALEGCRSVVPSDQGSMTDAQITRVLDSCAIVFRFGVDAPVEGRLSVISNL